MRRSKATIEEDRLRAWHALRNDGYNLHGMCLACGEIRHCRGKSRESVRCRECFTSGSTGAKLRLGVLGGTRTAPTRDEES